VIIALSSVLLAASIAAVTYAEAVAVRLFAVIESVTLCTEETIAARAHSTSFAYSVYTLKGVCSRMRSVPVGFRQWWSMFSVQLPSMWEDAAMFAATVTFLYGYASSVLALMPSWIPMKLQPALCAGFLLKYLYPDERFKQQARIIAAICILSKGLLTYTTILLPRMHRMLVLTGALTVLWAQPSDAAAASAVHIAFTSVVFAIALCMIALNFAGAGVYYAYVVVGCLLGYAFNGLVAVLKAVGFCVSLLWKSPRLLVLIGAIEIEVAAAVAQWCRSQQAKLQVQSKHVQRVWRRHHGNTRAFLLEICWGIEGGSSSSSTLGSASGGKAHSKKGSKRGSKAAAAGASRHSSRNSSEAGSAAAQHAEPRSTASAGCISSRYNSSSSCDEDYESLSELLTLPSVAKHTRNSNTKAASDASMNPKPPAAGFMGLGQQLQSAAIGTSSNVPAAAGNNNNNNSSAVRASKVPASTGRAAGEPQIITLFSQQPRCVTC
jgi:hypothetical protein